MADQAGPNSPNLAPKKADGFEIVTETHARSTDYRRRSPNVTVSESGYSFTNTNGTRTIERLWTGAGYKIEEQITMQFGSGQDKGVVRGYVALPSEPGTITLKRSPNGRSFSFHIGYLFDRYPELRPGGTVECALKMTVDGGSTPCLEINVRGGTTKRKGATEEDSSATQNQGSTARRKNNSTTSQTAAPAPAAASTAPAAAAAAAPATAAAAPATDVAAAAQSEPAADTKTGA